MRYFYFDSEAYDYKYAAVEKLCYTLDRVITFVRLQTYDMKWSSWI